MSKVVTGIRVTTSHLREYPASLDQDMTTINPNVEVLNLHIKENKHGLSGRG